MTMAQFEMSASVNVKLELVYNITVQYLSRRMQLQLLVIGEKGKPTYMCSCDNGLMCTLVEMLSIFGEQESQCVRKIKTCVKHYGMYSANHI